MFFNSITTLFKILVITGLPFVLACQPSRKSLPTKPIDQPTIPPTTESTASTSPDQILLVALELTHDSTTLSGERCTLVSTKTYNGKIKKPLTTPPYLNAGDLVCKFLDREGKVLWSQVQEDPLITPMEAADGTGQMARHTIHQERAELILRVQHTPSLYQLVVGTVTTDKSILTLAEIKL